ncbi:MAG: hypothetical protein PHH22_00225 [Clostridia bacterium]|nr:hypothetical protein [Clostridia bacterium]
MSTGMIYHMEDLIVNNDLTLVQLKELPKLWFYSTRFAEVEYYENSSDFDIRDTRMRHVVCVNNQDINWSLNGNASQHLKVGEIYHALGIEVHGFHTRVSLLEFPKLQFNSINFSEISISEDEEF